MYNQQFRSLIQERPGKKPRSSGLTVAIDHGIGLGEQQDVLEIASDYIDIAKIMVGIPALIQEEILRRKIALYHQYDVDVFPGGQFMEYAVKKNKTAEYLTAVKESGFRLVEVSDNILDISFEDKSRLIRTVSQEYGLKVLGETGSKKVSSNVDMLIDDIKNCLDSGAWKVMFEAAELFEEGTFKTQLLDKIIKVVDINNLIFECPGSWIPGITVSDIYALQVWLIEAFGASVNIANVDPKDVMCLEAQRNNLGTHMKV